MDTRPPISDSSVDRGFYLYSPTTPFSALHSGNVFCRASDEHSARALCRLFQKGYSSEESGPYFSAVPADDIELDEQILLEEALGWLDVYDDPIRAYTILPPLAK
jgi:hypothetical protein